MTNQITKKEAKKNFEILVEKFCFDNTTREKYIEKVMEYFDQQDEVISECELKIASEFELMLVEKDKEVASLRQSVSDLAQRLGMITN